MGAAAGRALGFKHLHGASPLTFLRAGGVVGAWPWKGETGDPSIGRVGASVAAVEDGAGR